MITLYPTASERSDKRLSAATLADACRAIREDGFVVLDRVVDQGHVAAIRDSMLADALRKIAEADGEAKKHIMQHPPRETELLFEDVLANPFGMQVAQAVIGPTIACAFYESNTNLPGSQGQGLHVDMKPRAEDDITDGPCDTMVLNIPLVDFTVENGATEVWPGSHMVPCVVGERWVLDDQQVERQKVRPKEQAVMAAGSLLLRDIRLWHRGVPNPSNTIRTMIAMIINAGPDRDNSDQSTISSLGVFPASARSFFAGLRLVTNPRFDDEVLVDNAEMAASK